MIRAWFCNEASNGFRTLRDGFNSKPLATVSKPLATASELLATVSKPLATAMVEGILFKDVLRMFLKNGLRMCVFQML